MITVQLNEPNFEYDIHSLVKAFYPQHDVLVKAMPREEFPESVFHLVVTYDRKNHRIDFKFFEHNQQETQEGDDVAKEETVAQDHENRAMKEKMALDGSVQVDFEDRKKTKNELKQQLYYLLTVYAGKTLPWGTLTGIRPTKIPMELLEEGKSEDEIRFYMKETYLASDEKIELSLSVAKRELELLSRIDYENGYSLYVGIPFCPSTCLYCSFTSYPLAKWANRMDEYLDALEKEIEQQRAERTVYQSAHGCIICTDETTGYKLTETGVEPLGVAAGICRLTDDGMTVTQKCTADETVLTAYNWNGQKTDSYTISNAYQSDDAEVRKHFAPQIFGSDGVLFWGTAGLYREENGRLVQVTDSPVISVKQDADGAYYAVSCDKSERTEYYSDGIGYMAGDMLVRIAPDGTQTTLATLDDILIDEVKTVKSGAVRFTIAIPTEGHRSGHYTCLLKDGNITVRSATDDVFYIWGNDALENEQEKIDKIIANQKGEE